MEFSLSARSISHAVVHRIARGSWPQTGRVELKSKEFTLVGRECDLIHMWLLDEPRTKALLRRLFLVNRGRLFLDAGANIGTYAIMAGRAGLNVLAYEPSPATFTLLERNVKINSLEGRVLPVRAAIGPTDGRSFLNLSIKNPGIDNMLDTPNPRSRVEVVSERLSAILKENAPDIVKMDIEGLEGKVLAEAKNQIRRGQTWIVEVRRQTFDEVRSVFSERRLRGSIIEALVRSKNAWNILFR